MILHITNDYSGSTVYMNLIKELDNLGVKQIVYTPVKSETSIGKNKVELTVEGSKIIYSNILNLTWDRLFYRHKIKKVLKDIEQKVDLTQVSMIHAHTWYSDGGVAYMISKKYNIPYIVTIRNSDINVFYKYLPHERPFGRKIIDKAKRVLTISASYVPRVYHLKSLSVILNDLKGKFQVLPNGVDSFWIDNAIYDKKASVKNKSINILYVGNFTSGKRIDLLQQAILELNKRKAHNIKLHIVGGDGSAHNKVIGIINRNPDSFEYYGKVFDKGELKNIFRKCDIFAMPSRSETFGLVYVESMLQGLPILYTKDEGIDGFYDDNIGEKVSKDAGVNEIKEKLELMISKIDSYVIPTELIKKNHDWKLIAKEYVQLYSRR